MNPGAYQNAGITVGQPANIPQAMMAAGLPVIVPASIPEAMPVAGVPVGALNYSNGV